jgi:hypothetical protein
MPLEEQELLTLAEHMNSIPVFNHDMNHKLRNIGSTERYIFHMQALLECCYI